MTDNGRRVRLAALILLVLAALGIVAAVAVKSLTPRSFAMGTLTGTLQAVGGPSDASPRPLSGTVTATTDHGIMTFSVGASGRFTVQSAVGTYSVTAQSPQYEGGTGTCHALGPVTVSKGLTSNITIECQEK